MGLFETEDKHESYGMLSFSRFNGGTRHYFGSSIEHDGGIELVLREGSVARGISNDWFHAGKRLFEIQMSPSQFTELITNMNHGSGVPVTIKYIDGKVMEEPPFTNKRLQFEKEFSIEMKKLANDLERTIANAKELLTSSKPLNKAQKEEIMKALTNSVSFLSSNAPYISSQFNEQMDRTVMEAKGEIDAMVTKTITKLGFEKLDELKQLVSSDKG